MKSKLDEFIREQNEIIIPATLPVIPMRDGVIVFPGSVVPFLVGRKKSVRALEYAVDKTDRLLFLAWQKDPQVEEPDANDLYEIGTIAQIVQVMKNPDGTFKVLVEGLERGLLGRKLNRKSLLLFEIELVKVRYRNTKHLQALVRKIKDMVDRYVEMTQRIPKE
ncbi:MAG: endopeptidase La, partial [Thermotoga sp.]